MIWDEAEGWLISDAGVTEAPDTAFTSRGQDEHITGRLIVRRVRHQGAAVG